ncbi:MAG TPA: alpha/beta fold hydrolase [Candidatus Acidoferrum sp.]|nr:alpha/beta fold hydrolase [Candidatus Acidoferrum sp.]
MKLIPAKSVLLCCALFVAGLFTAAAQAQGKLEKIRVEGASLKGNLEKDDPVRDVFVYLPPGYDTDTAKRYPVIYFLHGYGVTAEFYATTMKLPGAVDEAIAAGATPSIIVLPDARTVYDGSMYGNSLTTGDWETFIAKELVTYIDKHYRTLAKRESRGLSGHSMGGYGTVRIGMEHPEVFGSMYAMSSCCLLNQAPSKEAVEQQIARMAAGPVAKDDKPSFNNVLQAQAATWAPNPKNPPYYFDWPFVNGEAQPLVQAKWIANSPLVTVDQHVPALKRYKAIALEVGDKDSLAATNKQLDEALTRLGVKHSFEVYDGDHTNHVPERFKDKLLPFFSKNLSTK